MSPPLEVVVRTRVSRRLRVRVKLATWAARYLRSARLALWIYRRPRVTSRQKRPGFVDVRIG